MGKILVADDEEALRTMMSRQLRRAGHEVTLAEDGIMAAELLMQEEFDVVVSDMKMPRLDGMGLLARAKEIAPEVEFIILTGHGNLENAVEAFKTGNVFDYLLKPLENIHELDGSVNRAYERRHLKRENARLVSELTDRITELEEAKRRLSELAQRDGLTNLFNHRAIHAHLDEILEQQPDTPMAVMLMDMDGFKRLNDTYGHPMGDRALRHLAQGLQTVCPENAVIGRYGGDEFMVLLPGISADQGGGIAAQVRHWIAETPFRNAEGTALPLQLCFGLADTEQAGHSAIMLVTAADNALYEGKRRGGDAVVLHLVKEENAETMPHSSFSVLDGLVTAIDNKDQYTRMHSEDVTRLALTLAEATGCSAEIHHVVRVAGLLHDVGKIGVPDSILRKPGKLTDEEYEVMKNHVTLSSLIIHGLPHLGDIMDAVANHHERWDGTGYPKGLAGENIPFLGRIMAIADAFSAMTLNRPYRAGMEIDTALENIAKGAGTQFDPQLAQTFITAMREQAAASQLRKAA